MRERAQQINSVSGKVILFLSVAALLMALSGYAEPPQRDEGVAAHILQLSIVALVPMILLFLATADWTQPLRSARPLAFPAAALVLAFGALYYLEHYRNPHYVGRTPRPVASAVGLQPIVHVRVKANGQLMFRPGPRNRGLGEEFVAERRDVGVVDIGVFHPVKPCQVALMEIMRVASPCEAWAIVSRSSAAMEPEA
jgi:hypothetical protein